MLCVVRSLPACAALVLSCLTPLVSSWAWAAAPTGLPVTGALANVVGGPVSDGTYGLDFALYADETGGGCPLE